MNAQPATAPAHTAGPWSVRDDGTILGSRDGCSHVIVCTMPVWWSNQAPGAHASQDTQAANAALIARAPELLTEVAALRDTLADAVRIADDLRAQLEHTAAAYHREKEDRRVAVVERDDLRAEVDRLRDAINEALAFRDTPATYDKLRAALAQ